VRDVRRQLRHLAIQVIAGCAVGSDVDRRQACLECSVSWFEMIGVRGHAVL